ncbi:MAG: acetyltransferase [Bacteroidota bacterium]
MKKIFIYGAGGMGRVVFELLTIINETEHKWNISGYIDDGKKGRTEEGDKILGGIKYLEELKEEIDVVLAIADSKIKRKIAEILQQYENISFPRIIHPYANISKNSLIKKGCIVTYGSTVATKVVLEDFVFVNTASSIGHDSIIGKYTTIMPAVNISGNCKIGQEVLLGTKATVIPGKKIGNRATIGVGSVVFRNISNDVTVLGNPAKVFKF